MPAKSAAQQKAAGAALSAKRGDTPKSKLKGASKPDGRIDDREAARGIRLDQAQGQARARRRKSPPKNPGAGRDPCTAAQGCGEASATAPRSWARPSPNAFGPERPSPASRQSAALPLALCRPARSDVDRRRPARGIAATCGRRPAGRRRRRHGRRRARPAGSGSCGSSSRVVRRDVALAAEAAADIGRELAGGDDPVAVVVGLAGQAGAQEVGEEAAGLEAVGDEAGQILLGAEQAHHVGPVDEVAEAAGDSRRRSPPSPSGCARRANSGASSASVIAASNSSIVSARPSSSRGARRHVDLVAMAGEEEQEQVVRPGLRRRRARRPRRPPWSSPARWSSTRLAGWSRPAPRRLL